MESLTFGLLLQTGYECPNYRAAFPSHDYLLQDIFGMRGLKERCFYL